MHETQAVQGDLRFLLPVRPGQQVLILGHASQLAAALISACIMPVLVLPHDDHDAASDYHGCLCHRASADEKPLPFATGSLDHVFVPMLLQAQAAWVPHEVARVLKPGGWLLLGVHNAGGLQRLRFWRHRRTPSPGQAVETRHGIYAWRRELHQQQLVTTHYYGVHDDLQHPQHVIPLDEANTVRYFFERIYTPHSGAAAVARRFVTLLAVCGLQHLLFKHIAIVARRALPPEA